MIKTAGTTPNARNPAQWYWSTGMGGMRRWLRKM